MQKLVAGIVADIPLAMLERDATQPRQTFDDASLANLAESLKVRVEIPLKVRRVGLKRFVIVDGERRFRAAKLANLKTLPCLLSEETEQIEIAATQLTTSAQREDLQALDIAEFLVDLQKRQKKSPNELLGELAKRGLNEIGRTKLDAYIRLVELPEWAKDMMRQGKLAETHAQLILQALPFPAVLKELRADLKKSLEWQGTLTAKTVRLALEGAFRSAGIDLNREFDEDKKRAFPIEPCRACEFYKRIGGAEYCMNKPQFMKKQKEALDLKVPQSKSKEAKKNEGTRDNPDPAQVEPRKFKTDVVALKRLNYSEYAGLAEGEFDKTQCAACPHKRSASRGGETEGAEDTCFHPPCFHEKQRLHGRARSRKDKMRDYLDRWLRSALKQHIEGLGYRRVHALIFWLATGAVDRGSKHYAGQMHEKAARATADLLMQLKMQDLPSIFTSTLFEKNPMEDWMFGTGELEGTVTKVWMPLLTAAVDVFTRDQARFVALDFGLDLERCKFRIDEDYLRMKRKAELHDLAKIAGMQTVANLGAGALRVKLLDLRDSIGVPPDIASLYVEPFDKHEADEDEGFDDLDDEDLNLDEESLAEEL